VKTSLPYAVCAENKPTLLRGLFIPRAKSPRYYEVLKQFASS
jgi:hypothetical protein